MQMAWLASSQHWGCVVCSAGSEWVSARAADKNLGVFTGFLAGIAWKGTETFKQARIIACL